MYSEMVEGRALPVTLGGSGIWPVETATVQGANWLGSRGRLPLPMVMASQSCHSRDAKATLWKTKLAHYRSAARFDLPSPTCYKSLFWCRAAGATVVPAKVTPAQISPRRPGSALLF